MMPAITAVTAVVVLAAVLVAADDAKLVGYWPLIREYGNVNLESHVDAVFHNMAFAGKEKTAAVVFRNRNTFIKIPNDDGIFALQSFTYSAWWKPYDSRIGPLWQWTKTFSYGTRIWFEQEKDKNDLLFQFVGTLTRSSFRHSLLQNFVINQWNMVAVSFDAESKQLAMRVNDVTVTIDAGIRADKIYTSTNIIIGVSPSLQGQSWLHGEMMCVRLWSDVKDISSTDFNCPLVNGCTSSPCKALEACTPVPNSMNYMCEAIDVCKGVRCEHGGSCVVDGDSYKCNCEDGFWGDLCKNELCPDCTITFAGKSLCKTQNIVCRKTTWYSRNIKFRDVKYNCVLKSQCEKEMGGVRIDDDTNQFTECLPYDCDLISDKKRKNRRRKKNKKNSLKEKN